MPADERPPATGFLTLLGEGEVEILGRLPWSSNHTLAVKCSHDGKELLAVYKPRSGERPLADFPPGLFRREVAAYELSAALGWDVVPETVERGELSYGPGSLQRFVPADFTEHYFTFKADPAHEHRLAAICAFDIVANNADRKSGHCILGDDGLIWAIDHGLCFNEAPKLRTVIWELAGRLLPDGFVDALVRVVDEPPEALDLLLDSREVDSLRRRAAALATAGRFPQPPPAGPVYPWPPV